MAAASRAARGVHGPFHELGASVTISPPRSFPLERWSRKKITPELLKPLQMALGKVIHAARRTEFLSETAHGPPDAAQHASQC